MLVQILGKLYNTNTTELNLYNKKISSYRLLAAIGIQADYFAANTWAWEPLDELSQHKGHLVQVKSSLNLIQILICKLLYFFKSILIIPFHFINNF